MENWAQLIPYTEYLCGTKVYPGDEVPDIKRELTANCAYVARRTNADVRAAADEGDGDAMIDFALRTLTGYKCSPTPSLAVRYFEKAANFGDPGIRATAHALLAQHLSGIRNPLGSAPPAVAQLRLALDHCTRAAELGRSQCSAVLSFARAYIDAPWFPQESPVRDAWVARMREVALQDAQAHARVAEKPARYRCAARECEIVANKGKMFQQCSGKCDRQNKPSYCSKECQIKDWRRHKPYCRAGAERAPFLPSDAAPFPVPTGNAKGSLNIPIRGPDGSGIVVSSSTMSAEMLKEVQGHLGGAP